MLVRFILAVVVVLGVGLIVSFRNPGIAAAPQKVAPAAAPDPVRAPRPAIVLQLQPAGKLVTDFNEFLRLLHGPPSGDEAVKRFRRELEDLLTEKGFEGLDLNRPLAAYSTTQEKFADLSFVLVLPYTTEAEFLGLLERLKFKTEAVAGKKGVHKLTPPDEEYFEHDSFLRFADGWVYLGFNSSDLLDPARIVPIGELFDPQETAQIAVRVYPERIPGQLLKVALTQLDEFADAVTEVVGEPTATIFKQIQTLLRTKAELLKRDAKVATLRYSFEPLTGDQHFELNIVPKPGTALAKATALLKPTTTRFARMVPTRPVAAGKPTVAFGLSGRVPAAVPEFTEIALALGLLAEGEAKELLPEPLRPLAVEVLQGITRAAKTGDADFAFVVLGPTATEQYTIVAAASFDDPAKAEKALRLAANTPTLRKLIRFDAEKAGDLAVHTLTFGELLVPELQALFGKNAVLHLAFGKNAVFVALGEPAAALAALRDAEAASRVATPAPPNTRFLEVVGNFAHLGKLVTAIAGKDEGLNFAAIFGAEDKLVPLGQVAATGGETLVIRYSDNVKILFRSIFTGDGVVR